MLDNGEALFKRYCGAATNRRRGQVSEGRGREDYYATVSHDYLSARRIDYRTTGEKG